MLGPVHFNKSGIQVQIAMQNPDGKSVIRLILSESVYDSNYRELKHCHAVTVSDALGKLGSVELRELPEHLPSQITLTRLVAQLPGGIGPW